MACDTAHGARAPHVTIDSILGAATISRARTKYIATVPIAGGGASTSPLRGNSTVAAVTARRDSGSSCMKRRATFSGRTATGGHAALASTSPGHTGPSRCHIHIKPWCVATSPRPTTIPGASDRNPSCCLSLSIRCGFSVSANENWKEDSSERENPWNVCPATVLAAVDIHGCDVGNRCCKDSNELNVLHA